MVDFKKKAAGKKTKLAGKTLENSDAPSTSVLLDDYIEGNLYKVPLSAITSDPNQPRKFFDEEKLNELAESIKIKGVLQPVIIRKNDSEDIDTDFILVAGERRFRACKLIELDQIPTIYTTGDPAEIALIENLQRDDLKPIEEAEAYERVMKSHNYSQRQLSAVVGKSRSVINEILVLNKLPEDVKEDSKSSGISRNALLQIAKRDDVDEMLYLYEKIKSENLTVAKIKQLTRPKKARRRRLFHERALIKIIEAKQLISKINRDDVSEEKKKELWEEFNDLKKLMGSILKK